MFPRDGAGIFTLPSDRDDPIVDMCTLHDRLEIYTETETFMVQTPETVDPDRTNPNAPWINAKTHDVGASSQYVARTFLMASDMLGGRGHPSNEDDRIGALCSMHTVNETLLQCVSATSAFGVAQAAEELAVRQSGFKRDPGGRALERFPVIPELDLKVTSFLIPARRCITEICQLAAFFFPLKKSHSNIEHLLSKELEPLLGAQNSLVRFAGDYIPFTRELIDMRNGQEHASTMKGRKLFVNNFRHTPDGSLAGPSWHLDRGQASDIKTDMEVIVENLLTLAEGMFVGCFHESVPQFPPYVVETVENPNPKRPVRYRVGFDMSKLQMPPT